MAKVIALFPRQVFLGHSQGASSNYYSEVYEVLEDAVLELEAIVFAINSTTTVKIDLETTADPRLINWESRAFASLSTLTHATGTFAGLLRYVRVILNITANKLASVSVTGIARESS